MVSIAINIPERTGLGTKNNDACQVSRQEVTAKKRPGCVGELDANKRLNDRTDGQLASERRAQGDRARGASNQAGKRVRRTHEEALYRCDYAQMFRDHSSREHGLSNIPLDANEPSLHVVYNYPQRMAPNAHASLILHALVACVAAYMQPTRWNGSCHIKGTEGQR